MSSGRLRRRLPASMAGAIVLVALVLAWANRPYPSLPDDTRAERVVVEKGARRLRLMVGGETLREYPISLGARPTGHKVEEGDERTPEGVYTLDWRNPDSIAHLSIHVSYPDEDDVRAALAVDREPGGMIMIHGIRNGLGWVGRLHRFVDWTDGCIAVTNQEMDEILRAVPVGTPIEIRP